MNRVASATLAGVVVLHLSAMAAVPKAEPPSRKSPLAMRCGLVTQVLSPTAPSSLRDFIRTACVQECGDGRLLVDVSLVRNKEMVPWFDSGEACESATFSVLRADRRPIPNPPKAALQVVLIPAGRNRFDIGVRVVGYSEPEGPSGILLCGEFSGTAEYRRTSWYIRPSSE